MVRVDPCKFKARGGPEEFSFGASTAKNIEFSFSQWRSSAFPCYFYDLL